MMESALSRPSKIRKRANKACLACRARKVRCDVSQRGRPCMNCFLDNESCVVVDRASRRRKSTEDHINGDIAAEDASTEHIQRGGSAASSGEAPERDGDVRMEEASDGESREPDTLPSRSPAANASSSMSRAARADASLNPAPLHEPPQDYSSITSRTKHLEWAGEQSTLFGSEVTYSYYAFLEAKNLGRLLPQDASYLELQGCLRVPEKTVLDEFVKQYFLHVHPMMPLINEGGFWEIYGSPPAVGSISRRLSLLVFQAMLFAASTYVSRNAARALGLQDTKTARSAFFRRAKLLFDFEAEASPIAISQAALLLSLWSPPAKHLYTQTGSFWLAIAVQQAKRARAHQYKSLYEDRGVKSLPSAAVKHRRILKRLWWCIIVSDRMHSLCIQKPMQVTTLHFSHQDLQDSLSSTDMLDEIERSRVYNSGAKEALIKIFIQMTELAAVLTNLLVEILPPDEMLRWNVSFDQGEKSRIQECKMKMASWYDKASWMLQLPKQDSMDSASKPGVSESGAGFAHDSVVLYSNFIILIYQSAVVRLCHYECSRLVAQGSRLDPPSTTLPNKIEIAEKRNEIQQAAYGVVVCLKTLTQSHLTRWLPLSSIACVSLPLILSIIDVKLSPQPSLAHSTLHSLYESVRAYRPQQETTDWVANSIRHILDLSGLDRLHRPVVPSTDSQDWNTRTSPPRDAAEGLHPSLYLRFAVSWTPDVEGVGFVGERHLTQVDPLRVFDSALLNRIRSSLNLDAQTSSTASARPSVSGSTAEDQAMRQRIAAWQAHDQAVSLELGFDSSGFVLPEADGAGSPGPSPAEDEEGITPWRDVATRAFSTEGDAREAELLEAFCFQDQTTGENGSSPVEWLAQERSHVALDQAREAQNVLLETAHSGPGTGL